MMTRLLRQPCLVALTPWVLGLASVLMLSSAEPVSAAKLYKVVDADGKVTFSQYPPVEKDESHNIESVKVDSAGDVKVPITTIGNTQYCGDISLPIARLGSGGEARYLQNVAGKRKYWQQRLDRLEAQLEQEDRRQFKQNSHRYYGDSSHRNQRNLEYQKRKQASLQSLKELRCAVSWAAAQQHSLQDLAANNSAEIQRLQQVYSNLEAALQRNCGEEPIYDPSNPAIKYQRQEWRKCAQEYQSDMRGVQRQLSKASSSIQSTR